ncbi:MAG: SAM-dependent methyltransferase, partial [Actinomycetota bacterium]
MSNSRFILHDAVADYIGDHTTPPSELEQRLIDETSQLANAGMQISFPQARFMSLLTHLLQPRFAVEIGTFTGYSALVVAQALPADATLLACDVSDEWTSVGRPARGAARVAGEMEHRKGPPAATR